MPYVLKHAETSQIYTAKVPNAYGFPFYGVIYWNDQQEAEINFRVFLQEQNIPEEESGRWELLEKDENQIKLFNVKLNNNPQRKLYLDESGKPFVK